MFPGLDLYHTDPAKHATTVGRDLDDLQIDRDVSEVRINKACR